MKRICNASRNYSIKVDFILQILQSVATWSKWKSKLTYKAVYTQIDLFEEITIERIMKYKKIIK
jgi:hypothetical protein